MQIKRFVFNPLQVNTYVLWDETMECLIIDAACYTGEEQKQLSDFIDKNELRPVKMISTHSHVDHILGNAFVKKEYNIPLYAHKDGNQFVRTAESSASVFGLQVKETVFPDHYLDEGDAITFGDASLQVLYTPGHADGSICLYAADDKKLFAGDVLFRGGIGRTDLPTGDYDKLNRHITEKLFSLDDMVTVFPGHGPETTIGEEILNNPFINLS